MQDIMTIINVTKCEEDWTIVTPVRERTTVVTDRRTGGKTDADHYYMYIPLNFFENTGDN